MGGSGWRRAFCTSIPRDSETPFKDTNINTPNPSPSPSPSPRTRIKFGFLSSHPRFQSSSSPTSLTETAAAADCPKLQCKTTPRLSENSNPCSPKESPSRFSLFKTSLRLSRVSCGICLQNVKTGAIFTAECSHAFHSPCIGGAHVRKNGKLVCPVCNSNWREVPLLPIHPPSDQRAYNDDEPLLSPRFNPIPEEEDEEDEEFQGFFVTSTCRNVDVRLLPVAAVVSVGTTHETYAVALKIKAPPPPPKAKLLHPGRRAPIDLVTVLDISASMSGPRLQMLKRAMRLVISSLGSADRLSIIAFSSTPKRLLALRRMTTQGQTSARRIIDRLVSSQGSNAGDALRKASKVLQDRTDRNPVASIMLLSDAQDETTDNSDIRTRTSTRFAHLEIPVHSFGFGGVHELAEDAFAKCVGGLFSVVVHDLRLQLGSTPAEITAVYSCNGRPTSLGSGSVKLGDFYAEEERELLVELKVPIVPVGAHHVMSVKCSYKDPVSQELIHGKEQALLVPRTHAVRSSNPKIERLRNLFVTNRAIAEARKCVEHNELTSAHRMLTSARALIRQSGSVVPIDEYLDGLDAELKELHYLRQYQSVAVSQVGTQRRRMSEHEPAFLDKRGEPLTPTSSWRAAEKLAKVAIMRKSMNKVGDLHGFENARF